MRKWPGQPGGGGRGRLHSEEVTLSCDVLAFQVPGSLDDLGSVLDDSFVPTPTAVSQSPHVPFARARLAPGGTPFPSQPGP